MKRLIAAACAVWCLTLATAGAKAPESGIRPAVVSWQSGEPAATLQPALYVRVFSCVARSRFAYGYWTSANLAAARRGALVQCSARTPRGFVCLVTRCR